MGNLTARFAGRRRLARYFPEVDGTTTKARRDQPERKPIQYAATSRRGKPSVTSCARRSGGGSGKRLNQRHALPRLYSRHTPILDDNETYLPPALRCCRHPCRSTSWPKQRRRTVSNGNRPRRCALTSLPSGAPSSRMTTCVPMMRSGRSQPLPQSPPH